MIPGQTFNILDPGLPAVVPGVNAALVLGTCSAGDVNKVYSFANPKDVVDTLGQGELSEALCTMLAVSGGPHYAVRVNGSVAGAAGAITHTGSGSDQMALKAGAVVPYDSYRVRVLVVTGGQNGACEVRYSLDGGYTYSDVLLVPVGGELVLQNTGLTLEFTAAETFAAGDTFSFDCTAPFYGDTDVKNALDAFADSALTAAFVVLVGEAPTAAAAKTMASRLDVEAGNWFNKAHFVRTICATGRDDKATTIAEFQTFSGSTRVLGTYGQCDMSSSKPMAGWGTPRRSIVNAVAARAARSLISTDLGRVADNALPGVVAITHDEARSPMMDAKGFTTLRTMQGRTGFYITNGRLMSPPGSDYRYWQHGRVMDVACRVAWISQSTFIGASVRTVGEGTLDPRDAAKWQGPVNAALFEALMAPFTAEGTQGHVSGTLYSIDLTNNVLASDTLQSTVGIKPRGYTKFIKTQLSFTTTVGG